MLMTDTRKSYIGLFNFLLVEFLYKHFVITNTHRAL